MKIKLTDVLAHDLETLLSIISRDALVPEDASFDEKCKAMTKRRNIIRLLTEANEAFNKNVAEKVDAEFKKIGEEWKELSAELEAIEAKTDEDKKKKAGEKVKKERELAERVDKKIKDLGFSTLNFQALPGVRFLRYVDKKEAKEITVELDEKHGHSEFIKEQMERSISKLGISDDFILDLLEVLK